jgi:hypothetical protein
MKQEKMEREQWGSRIGFLLALGVCSYGTGSGIPWDVPMVEKDYPHLEMVVSIAVDQVGCDTNTYRFVRLVFGSAGSLCIADLYH